MWLCAFELSKRKKRHFHLIKLKIWIRAIRDARISNVYGRYWHLLYEHWNARLFVIRCIWRARGKGGGLVREIPFLGWIIKERQFQSESVRDSAIRDLHEDGWAVAICWREEGDFETAWPGRGCKRGWEFVRCLVIWMRRNYCAHSRKYHVCGQCRQLQMCGGAERSGAGNVNWSYAWKLKRE